MYSEWVDKTIAKTALVWFVGPYFSKLVRSSLLWSGPKIRNDLDASVIMTCALVTYSG